MKKLVIILLLLAVGIYACTQSTDKAPGKPYAVLCYNGDSTSTFCSQLPPKVQEVFNNGYTTVLSPTIQPPFDFYSWQTFIALNWPADPSGKPMGTSIDSFKTAPRVWEHYKDPSEIFGGGPILIHLQAAKGAGSKFLYMTSKSRRRIRTTLNQNDFQEADNYPLVDRNMNFALYEIKVNDVEDVFITSNHLTTIDGIWKFAPKGGLNLPTSDSNSPGSIEVKASWRILDPSKGDDTTKFFCRPAIIFIDSAHTTNHKELTVQATVGLVGMHIIRNAPTFNTFLIWSSFEHVDNAPDLGHALNDHKYSFYNTLTPLVKRNKPFDTKPGDNGNYLWNPTAPYAQYYKDSLPAGCSQVVRDSAIYGPTEIVNQFWQQKLKAQNSVWANYKLIGTQWKANGEGTPGPHSNPVPPAPPYMNNTTMETYMQSTSNCIGCHNGASVVHIGGSTQNDTISTALSFMIMFGAQGN